MGAPASARRVKCSLVDAGGVSSLPLELSLMLVCSALLGTCACVTGAWMTYLPGVLQVPLPSPITGAVVLRLRGHPLRMVGVRSLCPRGPVLGPF
jgi:hypothetical protein